MLPLIWYITVCPILTALTVNKYSNNTKGMLCYKWQPTWFFRGWPFWLHVSWCRWETGWILYHRGHKKVLWCPTCMVLCYRKCNLNGRFLSLSSKDKLFQNLQRLYVVLWNALLKYFHDCKQGSLTDGEGSVQLTSLY